MLGRGHRGEVRDGWSKGDLGTFYTGTSSFQALVSARRWVHAPWWWERGVSAP